MFIFYGHTAKVIERIGLAFNRIGFYSLEDLVKTSLRLKGWEYLDCSVHKHRACLPVGRVSQQELYYLKSIW